MVNTWVSDIPDDFSADLRLQLFQLPCPSPEAPPATSNEENKTEANRTDSPSVPGSNSALIQPKSPIYVKSLIQPRILDQTNVTAMATR